MHTARVDQDEERWAKVVGLVLPTDSERRMLLARLTYGDGEGGHIRGAATRVMKPLADCAPTLSAGTFSGL